MRSSLLVCTFVLSINTFGNHNGSIWKDIPPLGSVSIQDSGLRPLLFIDGFSMPNNATVRNKAIHEAISLLRLTVPLANCIVLELNTFVKIATKDVMILRNTHI